jgi:hypothetical protein
MLHAFVSNVSSVSDVCCSKVFCVASIFHVSSIEWDGQSPMAHIRRQGCEHDTEQAQA